MISNPSMQPAAFSSLSLPVHMASGDPLRASVGHLLARAYALPCSTAAQAFSQLVQPTSRFQLALDALLPLLSSSSEVSAISQTVYRALRLTLVRSLTNVSLRNESWSHLFYTRYMHPIRLLSILSSPFYSLHS
jgi:hypothetical protein